MKIFECLFETHKKVKLLENEIKELKDQLKEQSENFSEILKITRDTNEKLYRCDWEPKQNIRQELYEIARMETASYISEKMEYVKAFNVTLDILSYAVSNSLVEGSYLEFGVFSGRTINHIAEKAPDKIIYGFDCFEGLPETWRSGFEKGCFKVDNLPKVKENVKLVKGLFQDTLPKFIEEHREKCALIHIDCDLYSSTVCVLENLKERIVSGTIIVFDEYFNYPGWKNGEFKAFQEFVKKYNIKYEYIAYVEISEQVAIKII